MIPSDIRLYTWVDVEDVLLRRQEEGDWPEWLVWAEAYWDELKLGIRPETEELAINWLNEAYEPRFRSESELSLIILEGISESDAEGKLSYRTLPVILEETEETAHTPQQTPTLSRPGVLWPPSQDIQLPEIFPDDFPSIVAFHSFKGGVGRTLHALALAQALVEEKQKVLLIDGDLEAPGISWIIARRLPDPPVSFADLLALAHSDTSPNAEKAVTLVADRLQSTLIDGIHILPSFRNVDRLNHLTIRPEHLIQGAKNPFALTQILANLGKALDVDVILVDLRAGLSELSTGLILDPRIYRIFVTTLSSQSIQGTKQLFELIANRALPKGEEEQREEDPLPALVLSQVPQKQKFQDFAQAEEMVLEAAQPFIGEDEELQIIKTPFADSLLVLPETWEEVIVLLKRSGIVNEVKSLLERLPIQQGESLEEKNLSTLTSQREKLSKVAEKLIYAENAEVEDFLTTTSLHRLVSDHRTKLPIVVIIGAKGSGKTYTFLQIVRRKYWQKFVEDADINDTKIDALICPVLASKNLQPNARKIIAETRQKAAQELGLAQPQEASTIRDRIMSYCQEELHEGQWRERWLDAIAWSVGFQTGQEGAGRGLTIHLSENKQKLVAVIDGLEDLFQDFASERAQQTALRALLQEVPEWLSQQPNRSLGILIFVRKDIVQGSVRQNPGQMMTLYEPYALKLSQKEALRLVTWVVTKYEIQPQSNFKPLQEMDEEQLTQALIPLWGKKLGTDRSKQARSARFVLDALSDFNGQIQSRDLVRLLNLAAEKSINERHWQDRLLVPQSIRGTLPECGRKKIEEIEQENPSLKEVFRKLQEVKVDDRKIPFIPNKIDLSSTEVKLLEANGIVIRERDEYYMPEIFRLGLDFSFKGRGRTKVISLARRARQ